MNGSHPGLTGRVFRLTGALLMWIAAFVVVYVFTALACARNFEGLRVAGLGVVQFVAVLTCCAAAVSTIALMRAALRNTVPGEQARLTRFVTAATGVICLIALVWLMLPVLMVRACSGS